MLSKQTNIKHATFEVCQKRTVLKQNQKLKWFQTEKNKNKSTVFHYVCYTLGNHGTELKTDGHDLLRMSGVPMLAGIE